GAAAQPHQHGFHRARTPIPAAVIRRPVHENFMTAAGLRPAAYPVLPHDHRFHPPSPLKPPGMGAQTTTEHGDAIAWRAPAQTPWLAKEDGRKDTSVDRIPWQPREKEANSMSLNCYEFFPVLPKPLSSIRAKNPKQSSH